MSVLERISKSINAHIVDNDSVSFGTLVASHNAIMAVYVGSPLSYSSLYDDLTYQRPKPSEATRKLLYIKLSKAYNKMSRKNPKLFKNHDLEEVSRLIDCAIYDVYVNYNREKKKVNVEDRFVMLPKERVAKLIKIPPTSFDRKYFSLYHDLVSILQSGLTMVDRKASKRLM